MRGSQKFVSLILRGGVPSGVAAFIAMIKKMFINRLIQKYNFHMNVIVFFNNTMLTVIKLKINFWKLNKFNTTMLYSYYGCK